MTNFDHKCLALLYILSLLLASCSDDILAPIATLSYTTSDGVGNEMDVFFEDSGVHPGSPSPPPPKPAILYFHGGSWISGTREKIHQRYREPMLRRLVEKGFIIFSVDYRLIGLGRGHMENTLSDCCDALRYVISNAKNLGVDTTHIGLWGSSAGAHLAMMTAFTDSAAARCVRFLIDDFGPVDISRMCRMVPDWGREYVSDMIFDLESKNLDKFDSLATIFSPINYQTDIPVLIFHGEDDDVVDISQSRLLHNKLATNSRFITFPDNGHGLKNLDSTQLKKYMDSVENFLDTIR